MRLSLSLLALALLSGCGSITLPAAVRLADGTALVGTTTASMSGGTFQVASPDKKITCSGTYDALDQSPTLTLPVACTNGLYGSAVITRSPDGMSGSGSVVVSDGTIAQVAFGNNAGAVLAPVGTSSSAAVYGNSREAASSTPTYTGNCPNADSLDSAGRRCGARSAASRPGGYNGYGSWSTSGSRSSGGSTYVRSYTRKDGTRVRGHYRRR